MTASTATDDNRWVARTGQNELALLDVVNAGAPTTTTPEAVLELIDKHCWTQGNGMMHIGDRKAKVIEQVMLDLKPRRVLELGTFCGYSAVLMGSILKRLHPDHPSTKEAAAAAAAKPELVTIDPSSCQADVAAKIVARAGLTDIVTFVNDFSGPAIQNLSGQQFDMVFVDHQKDLYLPDVQAIVARGLLRKGGVVVSDNVGIFQSKEYLEWLRTSGLFSRNDLAHGTVEYSETRVDAIDISTLA
ncbi:S-adenosyl-L-methionine-dependent methyltransferase [Geranomyces variabilis]|nr:S-adenosyl-L-methionine-dependent methyltransferase [Geranomyces variabilis]KAJ3139459.1 hypothetical protein HDU90_008960 [Geranomyces variabilis]